MTDTIQVVRPFSGHELRVNELGVMSLFDVRAQEWIGIGVVIDLTEEHPNRMVGDMEVVPGVRRRWVSGWEPVDEDS